MSHCFMDGLVLLQFCDDNISRGGSDNGVISINHHMVRGAPQILYGDSVSDRVLGAVSSCFRER